MLIAGLTGGLACGKSVVAAALRDLGCHVVGADELGHEAMHPGGPAYTGIVEQFGNGVVSPGGAIDRSKLAAIVFPDPAELGKLNAIVHPAVRDLAQRRFHEIGARDQRSIVIYVAAILVETGGYREFSRLIVVSCTREQQIARALARAGDKARLSDVLARLGRQLPIEKKAELADYVIDAGSTIEETLRQTKIVFDELRKLA